jgi:metal-responsive CopG/Arc/MetJ family transcriptional regulator
VRYANLAQRRGRGCTFGMKIAVSIPDDVFAEAESLAQRLKTSRSELYSHALTEFVGHHAPERVTEQMNQVLIELGESEPDAFRAEAARRVFKRTEW